MKMKKILTVAVCLLSVSCFCACGNKVVTVADMQESKEEQITYIEMQEFELKEIEEESGREEVKYCAVVIPEGYKASEEIPGMYLHEKAPLDSSNVYYSVAEGNSGVVSEELTEQEYKESIEAAHKENGNDVTVEVESFEEVDMDGVPAYKIRSAYETGDNRIEQLTYMILAENTYTITYSQSADDELLADFEVTDGEIKLVKAEEVQLAEVAE